MGTSALPAKRPEPSELFILIQDHQAEICNSTLVLEIVISDHSV